MKHCDKLIHTMVLAAFFCCIVPLFGGSAFSATTAPVISVLPVINDGTVTPTRIGQRGNGNIYVSDAHAEGVLVFSPVGNLVSKIVPPLGPAGVTIEPGGVAFAKNGDLLVTQGTYVIALNPDTGAEKARFGTFMSAFAIAVDNSGTGNIFVSDIKGYHVQVFNDSYAPVDVSAGSSWVSGNPVNFIGENALAYCGFSACSGFFARPAGVSIVTLNPADINSHILAVVDSLNGRIEFFDQAGNFLSEIGTFGFESTHSALKFTYPQSIAFEYTAAGALDRAYILDTFQDYVMVLDATSPAGPTGWSWLADIGHYGHDNGDLIAPSDILIDKKDPDNNRLLVSNGFGSLTVFGISSLQPFNVTIDSIQSNSLRVNWTNTNSAFKYVHVYRSSVAGQLGTLVGGNLPTTATSFVDTPLAQYTTYYYTVRAVDLADKETNNVSQVSAKTTGTFNLAININGNGQVNGTAACTTGTCTSSQSSDALITLTATATGQSVFDGWTGDCFTTADTCLISMDAAKSVTAFFSAKLAFRVDGAYFDNLNDAYREAKNGSVIQVLAGTWPSTTHPTEYMTAWQAKTVTIAGGYDPTFTSNAAGTSTVTGRANLTAGKVIMKKFKVRQ